MARSEIRYRGHRYPVIGQRRIGGREYLLLKQLNGPTASRYLVYDRRAGMEGNLLILHTLPRSPRATQLLQILSGHPRLHHALPTVIDIERGPEQWSVLTQWVAGIDLAHHLTLCRDGKRRRYSPYMVFSLCRRLAHGLSQLHDYLQIVHGDLAPENIILGTRPQELVLVDFGSAWSETSAVQRAAGDGRRPFYAAPELNIPDGRVDERSDQFSASVLFYEFLTGELPFEGLGAKAAWPEFRDEFRAGCLPPSELLKFDPSIPREVWPRIDAVLAKGLAFDPDDRYPTDAAWRNALDDINVDLHRSRELTPWNGWLARLLDRIPGWLRPATSAEFTK